MLRADSLSVDKLTDVSEKLVRWFHPVMAAKMGAAGPTESPEGGPQDHNAVAGALEPVAPIREPAFELEETSFAVYMLSEEKLNRAINSGMDLSYRDFWNTRRCHHQIKTNGVPTGYARSARLDDGSTNISQLLVSDLARAFDAAIAWLNQFEADNPEYVKTNPLVRVLVVPAYHVHAFWLFHEASGRSDMLVIDAPTEMAQLNGDRLLSSREFLNAFAGVSPKSGLLFDYPTTRGR
ncbi:MAG: hypothetical protein QOD33_1047 [Pyrinomonadaceae bacterium]|jgi:hypothetical protein|nr:hypothetical protein [Pyrinomonadaceae bacterium]